MVKNSNKKIKGHNNHALWIVWLVIFVLGLIVLIAFGLFWFSPSPTGNPISTGCNTLSYSSNFSCSHAMLNGASLTVTLGQSIDTNLENVSFLWIPGGEQFTTPTNLFCPPPSSNTINSGTSCATPNGIPIKNNIPVNVIFIFSNVTSSGSIYSGTIWIEFWSAGKWNYEKIGDAFLKAT
jgi:hypothetical protein